MDRSTAETWEDMVEAPGLDGITLDLWGGGGGDPKECYGLLGICRTSYQQRRWVSSPKIRL